MTSIYSIPNDCHDLIREFLQGTYQYQFTQCLNELDEHIEHVLDHDDDDTMIYKHFLNYYYGDDTHADNIPYNLRLMNDELIANLMN